MSDESSWYHDEDDLGRRIQMQWMRIPPTHLLRSQQQQNKSNDDDDMTLFHHPTTLPISMTDLLGEPNLLSIWHKTDDESSSCDDSSYSSSSSYRESVVTTTNGTTTTITKEEWMEWYQTIWESIHRIYTNFPKNNEDEFSLHPFRNLELKTTISKRANKTYNNNNLTPIDISLLNDYLVTMSTQKNQTTTIIALLFIYAIQSLLPDQNLISSYVFIVLEISPLSFSVKDRKRITWLLSKVANQILMDKHFSKEELNQKLQPLLSSSENSNDDDTDPNYDWKRESYMAIVHAFINNEKETLKGL